MRRGVRLPLQIGTTSLWGMTRAALMLVPGVLLTPFGLTAGFGVLWVTDGGDTGLAIAGVLIFTPLALVWIALLQMRGMVRARPSDAVLGADGLRVEGGKHGGVVVPWAQLDPQRCSLRDVTNKQLTLGDMYRSDAEATGTAMTHLVVEREGQPPLVLAEAEAPEERQSLAALYASIQAGAWRGEVDEAPVSGEVVRCAACGAAVVPGVAEQVLCHRCDASVPMPAELRERVRTADLGRAARGQAANLVTKLIDQPGATRTNVIFLVGGLAMLLAWPASLGVGIWSYASNEIDGWRVAALLVFPLAVIPGLYALLRMQLVDRFALRLLTLDMGAREPARKGDPYGCHACGGPLVVEPDEVVVRCVYCDADNVLGLDLRSRTGRAKEAAQSLDTALGWRTRERTYWRWRVVPAIGLTVLGGWLLAQAALPLPPIHTLTAQGAVPERMTRDSAEDRMPSRAADGRLAVVRGELLTKIFVDDVEMGHAEWPAWDRDGTLLGVRGSSVNRFESGALGVPRGIFGMGITRVTGTGEDLGVTFSDQLVGVADTAMLGLAGPDGGHARAATNGRDAAVASDGQHLAFVRDVDGVAQVFTTSVGSPGWRQWTSDPVNKLQPTWSPDGRRLVWVVDEGSEDDPQRNLWIAGDDGSPARALTEGDADPEEPAWAADGYVYFTARYYWHRDIFRVAPEQGTPGPALAEVPALRAGPAGLVVERLTDDVHSDLDPSLSPDMRTLAYGQTRTIDGRSLHVGTTLRELASGRERALVNAADRPASLQWGRSPAWTPDGTELVYVWADEPLRLMRGDPAAGVDAAEKLVEVPSPAGLARPRVSPDGRTIAFEQRAQADAPWELRLRANDGTITSVGRGQDATWRADGAAFAFYRVDGERGQLMLATLADPTNATPVDVGDLDVRGVEWHPDGRWILEVWPSQEYTELLVVDAAGKTEQLIETSKAYHGYLSVGGDGWVYFTSGVMGQLDVWRVKLK